MAVDEVDPGLCQRLYRERFDPDELAFKARMWEVLVEKVFQAYVRPDDTVLDLGAGTCEFINAVSCGRKIAVDLNPDTAAHARGAEVLQRPSSDLAPVAGGSVDVVFSSNLLEHLPSKDDVLRTLVECHRVLRPGGKLVVLMPNVRYLPGRYWDYFDHHTPLSHPSLAEAFVMAGFAVERVVPRFLPYTVKTSPVLRRLGLVRLYLAMPFLWPLVGRQMLLVGARSGPAGGG